MPGFQTTIATFMSAKDLEELSSDCLTLTTALDHQVTIQRLRPIIDAIKLGQSEIDLIILNNDLTSGIPDELIESELPIYLPFTRLASPKKIESF